MRTILLKFEIDDIEDVHPDILVDDYLTIAPGASVTPFEISDLITAVQFSIAPQRQDLHTAIEISINSFFKNPVK